MLAMCKLPINALGLVKVDIVCWNKTMKGEIFINIRIMYGEYSKKEDYDLFGYTYIPAEPKKETSLQNQVKPDEVVKTQVPKSKVEQATERLRNNPSSGFMYIKKG